MKKLKVIALFRKRNFPSNIFKHNLLFQNIIIFVQNSLCQTVKPIEGKKVFLFMYNNSSKTNTPQLKLINVTLESDLYSKMTVRIQRQLPIIQCLLTHTAYKTCDENQSYCIALEKKFIPKEFQNILILIL